MDLKRLILALASFAYALPAQAQLVAFVSSDDAPVTKMWKAEQLPFLEELAAEHEIELRVIDVAKQGAPSEVAITPLIVFQNHRGRSTYQGRSSNRTRIRNFVRTSSVITQSSESWSREQIPVWKCGRSQVAAPLKITALSGTPPDGFDASEFLAASQRAIVAGLDRFKLAERIQLGRSDRTFYFDFYPHRSEGGEFYVSISLFSQFHCKEAIFASGDSISGTWDERERVFAEAARALEEATIRLMRESELGDAFDCITAKSEVASWAQLNLELPSKPEGVSLSSGAIELPRSWRVTAAEENAPARVLFRFPPPLDGTAGEVGQLAGTLELGEGSKLHGASGSLVVEVDSVTLGVVDLDQVVKSVVMLDAKKYPQAKFEFGAALSQEGPLEFGRQCKTLIAGTFTMKGESIPIEVTAIWEPIVDASGAPRLVVDGAFSIRLLKPFGIKGPDGPSPARDTLRFNFALRLAPADE